VAPTFEGEAAKTKFCPACGSKKVQQIYNNPNVIARGATPDRDYRMTGTSLTRRADSMLQDSYDHHAATRPAKEVPTMVAGHSARRINMPGGREVTIPSAVEAAGMLGVGGKGRAMDTMEIARAVRQDSLSVPSVLGYTRNGGRSAHRIPTVLAGRPKE